MKIGKSKEPVVNGLPEKGKEKENEEVPSVDIMAQQLKFVACLKILMEELSTLATGFEVDGKFFFFMCFMVFEHFFIHYFPIQYSFLYFENTIIW